MNNDRTAQKAVYEAMYEHMWLVCRRYLKTDEDVYDVVNKGFMSVFQNIGSFGSKGSFEGWVRRIMVNKALDHLRSTKSYRQHTQSTIDGELPPITVSNDAISNLNMEVLLKLVDDLPPTTKAVFNLSAIEGYPHKEIAELLGMSEATSRWHLNAARKQLKEAVLALNVFDR